jgi:hypothetical protein
MEKCGFMYYITRFWKEIHNKRHSSNIRNHAHKKYFNIRVEKYLMLRKQGEIILQYMQEDEIIYILKEYCTLYNRF